MTAREYAFDLLQRWSRSRAWADDLIADESAAARARFSAVDRALVTELFFGCLRNLSALDWLIARRAPRPPRPIVVTILRLGLYQLFYLDKIPAHASVHETVELAKQHLSLAEAKFVNAVLRSADRGAAQLRADLLALREREPWNYFSQPRWLFEKWEARWGRADALALAEWNNRPPSVYLRVNSLKTPCVPSDIATEPSSFHPLCFRVIEPGRMIQSNSWVAGEFYVQDPSTLAAVDALDPQAGESVLDMCAAPGGKATYIAQKMKNRGRIIAADSSSVRLGLVAENCQRLGVTIVAALPCEGTRLDRCLRGDLFDRVLVDAPCSNTGVLRRRVDLRWRIEEKEIKRLAALQAKLLSAGAAFTKPGGVLVYSTCSLELEENERIVEQFRRSHPRWLLGTMRSVFPPRDAVDGAFVARFRNG